MTVLQRNAATGVDVGQLARTIGKALAMGAIVVGVVFAVSSTNETPAPTETPTRVEALTAHIGNTLFSGASAADKAAMVSSYEAAFPERAAVILEQREMALVLGYANGNPVASGPFMYGSSTPTHTGRTQPVDSAPPGAGDKADLLFKQKRAALVDPADRIHKQKAAELAK
jgi:hypothetical protein